MEKWSSSVASTFILLSLSIFHKILEKLKQHLTRDIIEVLDKVVGTLSKKKHGLRCIKREKFWFMSSSSTFPTPLLSMFYTTICCMVDQ